MSLFIFGGYWSYDNPASLQTLIMKDYTISVTVYSYLYSIYSLPNIILPLFGGLVIERIGLGRGLILTTGLVFIGQFVQCIGGYTMSYGTLILGRAIYGIGGETMYVIRQVFLAKWFFD